MEAKRGGEGHDRMACCLGRVEPRERLMVVNKCFCLQVCSKVVQAKV